MGKDFDGANHRKTAVLELLQSELVLLGVVVARPVSAGEAEVANWGALGLLPSEDLPVSNRGGDLKPSEGVDGRESADTVGDGVEGGAVEVNAAGEAGHRCGDETRDRQHGNTAVLELRSPSRLKGLRTKKFKHHIKVRW